MPTRVGTLASPPVGDANPRRGGGSADGRWGRLRRPSEITLSQQFLVELLSIDDLSPRQLYYILVLEPFISAIIKNEITKMDTAGELPIMSVGARFIAPWCGVEQLPPDSPAVSEMQVSGQRKQVKQ